MKIFQNQKNSIGCRSLRKPCGRNLFSMFLIALLVVGMFAPAGVITAHAAEDTTMEVYKGHSRDAAPFYAANMFPGDSLENRYNVRISYTGRLTLHFRADVRPGYEKLAEVLMCRVRIADETVYEGLLRDVPAQLDHRISSQGKTTETIPYDITVWLDTSVGNEYMNQELVCDFVWWVDVPHQPVKPDRPQRPDRPDYDDGELVSPPKTGDQIMIWVLILCASGAVLAVLYYRKRKEDKRNAGK